MLPFLGHTADWHLRESQYGYAYRGVDFFNGAIGAIRQLHANGVREIAHGGDMLDKRTPATKVIDQLLEVNAELNRLGMRMYAVTGNHERTEPSWIELLEKAAKSFGSELAIRCVDNRIITLQNGMTMLGLPSMSSADLREYLADPQKPGADILLWHGAVKEFANFPGLDAISANELLASGKFRCVLLGDIHIHKYFSYGDGGIIGYPDSTEFCSANESPNKAAGLIYTDGRNFTVGRIEVPTRPVLFLRVGNEEDLQVAIDTKIIPSRGTMPMIFVAYHPAITNAVPRIYASMDPGCVLRAKPIANAIPAAPTADPHAVGEETKTVEHFLDLFIPSTDSGLHQLAQELLRADTKPTSRLAEYVDAQLGIAPPSADPHPVVQSMLEGATTNATA